MFGRGADVERMWGWKGRRRTQRDAPGGVYQVGDVTVDLDRFELQRAVAPQHVEPQGWRFWPTSHGIGVAW